MAPIPFNPYIVGNPIKTKEMFFGREDEFFFVYRKIGESKSNQIVVFCGDRRSGKTSILFQILLGRLGERFLPILVDLQILAGIKNDQDFYWSVMDVACSTLSIPGLTLDSLKERFAGKPAETMFREFLSGVRAEYPDKTLLFLFDEYELIETKIKEGTLSESIIHFLAGVLEGTYRISFIFTGSTNLENRKVDFWKTLLGKSIYKKISYLSYNDTVRLITEPLSGHLSYAEGVIETVYRLTGGQPFYTQVVCQNLVDLVMDGDANEVTAEYLETVVKDIVNNPLPQMIYSWSNLKYFPRLVLSALASVIRDAGSFAGTQDIVEYFTENNVKLPFKKEQVNMFLEDAYQREFVEKNDEGRYRFRMDLFRRWIKKEHSIWKVLKEAQAQRIARPDRKLFVGLAASVAALAIALVVTFFAIRGGADRKGPDASGGAESTLGTRNEFARNLVLLSNYGSFRVLVDGDAMSLSSEGLGDGLKITIPSISTGEHAIDFILPVTGERITRRIVVIGDNQEVGVVFRKPSASQVAAASDKSSGDARQALGTVLVSSNPPGASIAIDGRDSGALTPSLFQDLAFGAHTFELELEGYKRESRTITIKSGSQAVKEDVVLRIASGFIVFKIRPAAIVTFEDTARIVVQADRTRQIETPRLRPLEIQAGIIMFTITNEDLGVLRNLTVRVEDGKTLEVDWDLTAKTEPEVRVTSG